MQQAYEDLVFSLVDAEKWVKARQGAGSREGGSGRVPTLAS
jgi:hypothetical protein